MSRIGKIARLPLAIREQVNTRLQQGEPSRPIADWLNSDPSVKAILDQDFEGRPVTEDNLNEWRAGGHQEWKAERMAQDMFHRINQLPADRLTELQGGLIDRMATLFASQMLAQMKRTQNAIADPDQLANLWRQFRLSFASLRRYQFATVALHHRLHHPAAAGQPCLDRPLTDDEQDESINDLLGVAGSAEANTFDPVSQTWSGPNAETMNLQHRKLLLQAAKEAGFDPAKTE
ncbi:MAG: hypothetical protein ABSH38_14340 [Verrucomicrobiota bacterium]|jgi:hypothetical protein